MLLHQILANIIHKNYQKSCKNNKLKISATTWNEESESPDGSYSTSNVQDYFEYIFKKHREKTVNLSIRTYTNKIENRITFKMRQDIILNF